MPRVDVRFGSNSEVETRNREVRLTPNTGHRQTGPAGPSIGATSRNGDCHFSRLKARSLSSTKKYGLGRMPRHICSRRARTG
jgi:hypothetical protein